MTGKLVGRGESWASPDDGALILLDFDDAALSSVCALNPFFAYCSTIFGVRVFAYTTSLAGIFPQTLSYFRVKPS